jgi:hypothetical protein
MSDIDNQIDRLFRAAANQAMPETMTPPFGLETRVLAAWREGETFHFWSTPLLLRGLAAAAIIMALSFWPLLENKSTPDADYLQLADSTLQAGINP